MPHGSAERITRGRPLKSTSPMRAAHTELVAVLAGNVPHPIYSDGTWVAFPKHADSQYPDPKTSPVHETGASPDTKMVEERFKARLATMSDSLHPDGPSEGPPRSSGTPDGLLVPNGRPHALAEQGQ
jgi:hypothetical protein